MQVVTSAKKLDLFVYSVHHTYTGVRSGDSGAWDEWLIGEVLSVSNSGAIKSFKRLYYNSVEKADKLRDVFLIPRDAVDKLQLIRTYEAMSERGHVFVSKDEIKTFVRDYLIKH